GPCATYTLSSWARVEPTPIALMVGREDASPRTNQPTKRLERRVTLRPSSQETSSVPQSREEPLANGAPRAREVTSTTKSPGEPKAMERARPVSRSTSRKPSGSSASEGEACARGGSVAGVRDSAESGVGAAGQPATLDPALAPSDGELATSAAESAPPDAAFAGMRGDSPHARTEQRSVRDSHTRTAPSRHPGHGASLCGFIPTALRVAPHPSISDHRRLPQSDPTRRITCRSSGKPDAGHRTRARMRISRRLARIPISRGFLTEPLQVVPNGGIDGAPDRPIVRSARFLESSRLGQQVGSRRPGRLEPVDPRILDAVERLEPGGGPLQP